MSALFLTLSNNMTSKTPLGVCKMLKTALEIEGRNDETEVKIKKSLSRMRKILSGHPSLPTSSPKQKDELCRNVVQMHLLPLSVTKLHTLDFEGKKNVARMFPNILHRLIDKKHPAVELLSQHPRTFDYLIENMKEEALAHHCGYMLRQSGRHKQLARLIFKLDSFYKLFELMDSAYFSVSAEAYTTLNDMLMRFEDLAREFLKENFGTILSKLMKLYSSPSLTSRWQAMELLRRLLFVPQNGGMKKLFFQSRDNVKFVLKALDDDSMKVRHVAFEIFQAILDEPEKCADVAKILRLNQSRIEVVVKEFAEPPS